MDRPAPFGRADLRHVPGLQPGFLDKSTDQADQAICFAFDEARRLRHNAVGAEHLLLGLLCEKEGNAVDLLTEKGNSTRFAS